MPTSRPVSRTPRAGSAGRSTSRWSARPISWSEPSRRAASGVVDVVDRGRERADLVEPPPDVPTAVAAGDAAVPPDGEDDLATGPHQFVGDLHARGRRADHEHPTVGQLARVAVRGGRELGQPRVEAGGGTGDPGLVAPTGGHDDVAGRPGAPTAAIARARPTLARLALADLTWPASLCVDLAVVDLDGEASRHLRDAAHGAALFDGGVEGAGVVTEVGGELAGAHEAVGIGAAVVPAGEAAWPSSG